MVASEPNLIGIGIYTPAEAAYYARVDTRTMLRWVHGNQAGDPVIHAQLDDDERTITFLDFVQALAIRAIRIKHKISLQKIREAVEHAQEKYHVEFPFAMRHRTYLFQKEIIIDLPDRLALVQITPGKHQDQMVMPEIAEPYLSDLSFSEDDLAVAFRAFEHGGRTITIDPHRRFGQPIVEGSGYSVQALLDAYQSEGSVESAARAYGVQPEDIFVALHYQDHLWGTIAA